MDPTCESEESESEGEDEGGDESEGCTSYYPYVDVTPNMIV